MDASYEDEFSQYYADLLAGSYDCVDRLVVNCYFSLGVTPGGFRCWWRRAYGTDDNLDDTHLIRDAAHFGRRARGWAKKHGVPVVFCDSGERKHELAEQHIPKDPGFVGVFLIQVSRAPAATWEARRFGKGGLDLTRKWRHVNHYSFHIIDPDWGHLTIRMSCHPPYGAMAILNGHEWVERKARAQALKVTKEGNCFTQCSDNAALDQIAESLNSPSGIGRLSEVCDRWIYSACLCFALDLEDQERSSFQYNYSIYQIEQSRNLIFKSGRELEEVFQSLIDRTRRHLDVPKLKSILGLTNRKSRRSKEPTVTIEKPSYDLTVFKVRFNNITLKIYDKGECVLRIEAIAHNARELRCGIVISKLSIIITKLKEMVVRFLNILRGAHICLLDQGLLDDLPKPSLRGSRRLAGVDINQPRMRHFVQSVIAIAAKPDGFTLSDLTLKVRRIAGLDEKDYGVRQAAYDIAKLSAKGMVEKTPRSRRYHVPTAAFQALVALIVIREKVIKPVLAGAGKPRVGRPPKHDNPLDQHYQRLQVELRATIATLGIATA
jgi:hypothetical protein